MRITYELDGNRMEGERDVDTWYDAFELFADVLRGAGYRLPFDNEQLVSALTSAEDYGLDDFTDTIEDPALADGGQDE